MFGYLILAAMLAFLAIILVRTLRFTPKPQPPLSGEAVTFDKDAAVDALVQLVRCKTVSSVNPAQEDDAEFQKLFALLPTLYPRVFDICSVRQLPGRGLLLRWPGNHPRKQRTDPSGIHFQSSGILYPPDEAVLACQ